jgi:hypothetical protein
MQTMIRRDWRKRRNLEFSHNLDFVVPQITDFELSFSSQKKKKKGI